MWFDSGAMPFAQHHFPFENERALRAELPGGLHLRGAGPDARLVLLAAGGRDAAGRRRAPYRNVVCLGLILDEEGQKMSKSKGNTVEPWEVLDTYGADAFRWYFFTSKQPWDGYRFSAETIGEGVRLFLKQLWAPTTSTRSTRARPRERAGARRGAAAAAPSERPRPLGAVAHGRRPPSWSPSAWTPTTRRAPGGRSRSSWTSSPTGTCAARGGASGTASAAAFATLRTCLLTVAKLLAPFCPFIADEIYDNLDGDAGERAPVRLPAPARSSAPRDEELEQAMALARETVRLGPGRARQGEDQGAPAARRGGRRRRRARARGDRTAGGRRARGAERQARALRRGRRGAGQLRGEGQLPHARARCSARRCRWRPRRSRRSTRRAWRRRCATATASSASRSAAASTRCRPRT